MSRDDEMDAREWWRDSNYEEKGGGGGCNRTQPYTPEEEIAMKLFREKKLEEELEAQKRSDTIVIRLGLLGLIWLIMSVIGLINLDKIF